MKNNKVIIPVLGLTAHGGNRIIVEVANKLVESGHDVTFVTPNRHVSMPFILDPRIKVKKTGPLVRSKILAWLFFLILSPFFMIRSNILANHFLTVLPSWLASVFLGSEYVCLVQDIEFRFYKGKFLDFPRRICEWTYRRGRLVAANDYLAAELKGYTKLLLTLKLGVASDFFNIDISEKPKKFDIVYFLRAEPRKRIDRFDSLLPFFKQKNLKVLCISQDTELMQRYHGQVSTCCPSNDIELINAVDQCRVLLLTSEHEGFSLPPLEAMARGVPTVMYPCGGPDVYAVHGENCLYVMDERVETALDAVEILLQNPKIYGKLSKAGMITASNYHLDNSIKIFSEFLGKIFK